MFVKGKPGKPEKFVEVSHKGYQLSKQQKTYHLCPPGFVFTIANVNTSYGYRKGSAAAA
jgi:hypothetical protein